MGLTDCTAARPVRIAREDATGLLTAGQVARRAGLLREDAGSVHRHVPAACSVSRLGYRWREDDVAAWLASRTATRIYFIRRRDTDEVKIGISSNLRARLRELQVAHGEPLELWLAFVGTEEDELYLHLEFERDHKRGEWFRESEDIRSFVEWQQARMGVGGAV